VWTKSVVGRVVTCHADLRGTTSPHKFQDECETSVWPQERYAVRLSLQSNKQWLTVNAGCFPVKAICMFKILQSLRIVAVAFLSGEPSTINRDCSGLDFEIGRMSTLKAVTAEGSFYPRRAQILTAMIGTNRWNYISGICLTPLSKNQFYVSN
jgi:hypothetical protein